MTPQGTTDPTWLCRCGHVDAEHDSEDRSCDAWVERGQRCPCPSFDSTQGTTDPEDGFVPIPFKRIVMEWEAQKREVASLRAENLELRQRMDEALEVFHRLGVPEEHIEAWLSSKPADQALAPYIVCDTCGGSDTSKCRSLGHRGVPK